MRLLVTGALGKVGRATVVAAQHAGHEVYASDRAPPAYGPTDPDAAPYVRADLTDAGQALDPVGRVRPDAVVHTAGIPEPFQDTEVAIFDTDVPALSKVLGEHMLDALVRRQDDAVPVTAVSIRPSLVTTGEMYSGFVRRRRVAEAGPSFNQWTFVDAGAISVAKARG